MIDTRKFISLLLILVAAVCAASAADDPMAKVTEIIVAERKVADDGHWYANFSYRAPDSNLKNYRDGARLLRVNIRTGETKVVLEDPRGGIRDPQVHYNGKKILFSYRRGGTENYNLYEINADGTNLKELTKGPWDDLEPTYLPDGGIAFVSSRAMRWVNCWLTQVATLHRCNADGSNIQRISANPEQDNTPWPLPDGRILYMRWEYVDRSQVDYHHLWTKNPDGTNEMVYYGNQAPSTVMLDAKPIPGTDKIVSVFSPGHGAKEHEGHIAIVDPRNGPDDRQRAKVISRDPRYRDPWGFSEDCIMAARGPEIVILGQDGERKTIYKLPDEDIRQGMLCHEPRPLLPRPRETVIQSRVKPEQPTGRFFLADVYKGRNMGGVKRGDIKKLLVLESLPKPINFTGGMDPLTFNGSFSFVRILGTVPVEEDGSAFFEAPATRSMFFVALDENDLSVKRMQSFTMVMPGETMGCIGCHEKRVEAPRLASQTGAAAVHRQPSKIQPFAGVPGVMEFPRDVQPILDRRCVSCHNYGKREGRVILTGDRGPFYSHSYFTLTVRGLFSDGRNQARSNYPPRAIGSSASRILKMVDGSHFGAKLTPEEVKTLRLWIEVGAPYPGTTAAMGSGEIGGFYENIIDRADLSWPENQAMMEAIKRRCNTCHKRDRNPVPDSVSDDIASGSDKVSRHIVFNLTRPEKSMLLLAPLSAKAGGYGICKGDDGEPPFASTGDPDYKTILAGITRAKNRLDEVTRFDMPNFRPRSEWVREMKRYGILPASTAGDAKLNCYTIDDAYWKSFWYRPAAAGAGIVE